MLQESSHHNNLSDLFQVSGLKEKASLAKSASIRSYDSARGRLSTNGTSNTAKAKPPPPPPRRTSSNQAPGDPSIVADVDDIDWQNLSDEDKQAFFAWLDEFFARYLGLPLPATTPTSAETSSNTPAPSLRPSPSLPPRRVSFRENESTGPETPAEAAAPEPGRRKLPPMLSQKGPVSPSCWRRLLNPWLSCSQPNINHSTRPSAPTEAPPPPLPNTSTKPSHSSDPSLFPCSSSVSLFSSLAPFN